MSRIIKGNRFKSKDTEEPVVNLTPLIDVVFVILIMFILVAPLLELDRVELADAGTEQSGSIEAREASPLSIHVHKDNVITFNGKKVELGKLPLLLAEAKKKYPTARLQLFHDKRAFFGTYQAIKNTAEQVGFSEMDIILKPS